MEEETLETFYTGRVSVSGLAVGVLLLRHSTDSSSEGIAWITGKTLALSVMSGTKRVDRHTFLVTSNVVSL